MLDWNSSAPVWSFKWKDSQLWSLTSQIVTVHPHSAFHLCRNLKSWTKKVKLVDVNTWSVFGSLIITILNGFLLKCGFFKFFDQKDDFSQSGLMWLMLGQKQQAVSGSSTLPQLQVPKSAGSRDMVQDSIRSQLNNKCSSHKNQTPLMHRRPC